MAPDFNFVGIDYGAKLAGTTAICYAENASLIVLQSTKGMDADVFLTDRIETLQAEKVFIDAPLSLPAAYFQKGDDYFYRKADKECKAMSPMFLGGLTARAMRLKNALTKYAFVECYPGMLAREILNLSEVYTKRKAINSEAVDRLQLLLPLELAGELDNWHKFDAVLCWLIGYRFERGEASAYGDLDEGQIFV